MAAGMEGRVRCTGRTRATEGKKALDLGEELEQRPRNQVWSLAPSSPF